MIFKKEKILFEQLKKDISTVFLQENSTLNPDISQWKGIEITYFQEHLLKKVKSTVSEKWFYTYFKQEFSKLPRIDMLNILCKYAGYKSWSDFKDKNNNLFETIDSENLTNNFENLQKDFKNEPKTNTFNKKYIYYLLFIFIIFGLIFGIYYIIEKNHTYKFVFVDSDRNTPLKSMIEVEVLRKGFASKKLKSNNGYIEYKTYDDTLILIANSAFHKKDTFRVNLNQYNGQENLELKQDDYAVMLYYYSRPNQDLIKRKLHLENLISNNAKIYQLYDNEDFGMEPLTKEQYINLLLLPTTSLKNYILIDSEMKNGKIINIRFKIQQDEK